MTTVALRGPEDGGGVLVDAFDEQALAIAGMAASPNTRRAYATAYRAFAGFLRARYGEASRDTVTIASVAAWRDELAARGLAPSSVSQRISAINRAISNVWCSSPRHRLVHERRRLGGDRCALDRLYLVRSSSRSSCSADPLTG